MILNSYEDKKIDVNLPSNKYFPKSISTKHKNDQGKSYSDRTDRMTEIQKDRQSNFMIQTRESVVPVQSPIMTKRPKMNKKS